MKTSKIIFFSLPGAIALLILAAFIDVRLTGRKNTGAPEKAAVNVTAITPFSVIMAEGCNGISVTAGASPSINLERFDNSKAAAEIKYIVKNDTLFISDVQQYSEERNIKHVTINTTGLLKRVIAENSRLNVNQPATDELSIDADNSDIFMSGSISGNSRLRLLSIDAKNKSDVTSNDFTADSVSVTLHGSKASLMIKAEKLNGTISSESNLTITQPGAISLKTDQTSQLYITHFEK